jgi:hypothetical protein
VYCACCDLPYGKEDQMLFIDDEPNKVLQNPKEIVFSSSPLSNNYCQKIKCNFKKKTLQVNNKVTSMVKIFCLHPIVSFLLSIPNFFNSKIP